MTSRDQEDLQVDATVRNARGKQPYVINLLPFMDNQNESSISGRCSGSRLQCVKRRKGNIACCRQVLVATKLFNIPVNDFGAKICVRSNRTPEKQYPM